MSEELSSYTFVWSIENFSSCSQQFSEYVQSPVFEVENLDGAKFYLKLYPRGKAQDAALHCDFSRDDSDCGPEIVLFLIALSICLDSGLESIKSTYYSAKLKCTLPVKLGKQRKYLLENNEVYLPNDTLTLQCCLIPDTFKYKSSKKCFAKTVVAVKRHVFVIPLISKSFVTSPALNLPFQDCFFNVPFHFQSEYGKFEFVITSCLNFKKKGEIRITRKPTSTDQKRLFMVFKIFLEDFPAKPKCIAFNEQLFLPEEEEWIIPISADETLIEFVPKGEMFPVRLDIAISDDSYSTTDVKTVHDSLEVLNDSNFCVENGCTDIWKAMFNDNKFFDVHLRVEDESFSAHKSVLCASSPVFSAMFENEMKEKETGIIEIGDMTKESLQQLLRFIYTGSVVDLKEKTALELYVAADKYQILSLKNTCSSFLKEKLTLENVCDILDIADLYQDQELALKARCYIRSHARNVFASIEWENFMEKRLRLAADVMLDLCKKFSE